MAEKETPKKDTIIIAPLKKLIERRVAAVKKNVYQYLLVLIFIFYLVLLVAITFLPITNCLRILSLLIGSFILEDIHHSLKKICQT